MDIMDLRGIRGRLMTFVAVGLFALVTIFDGALGETNHQESRMAINKKISGDTVAVIERKEGKNIVLNCEYNVSANDITQPTVNWYIDNKYFGDTNNQQRSYTLKTRKGDTVFNTLYLKNLMLGDTALYECKAETADGFTLMTRKVRLFVIRKPRWTDLKVVAAEKLDSQLIVDCNAEGEPKPDVDITDREGGELPPRFAVVDNTVVIDKLTMEDINFQIKCVATQVMKEYDENPVEEKIVTIDVQYPPIFEGGFATVRYGVNERNVTIPCRVTGSNPPVHSFDFFQDNVNVNELRHEGFEVKPDLITQSATLFILKSDDSHFSKNYTCSAFTATSQASQQIFLKKTTAPKDPNVAEMDSNEEYTVKWRLEDDKNDVSKSDGLQVVKYRIKYVQESLLLPVDQRMNLSNPIWNTAHMIEVKKDKSNIYKVKGLTKDVRYGFRFQSVDDAAESDWSSIFFTLVHKKAANGQPDSRTFQYPISFFLLPYIVYAVNNFN